MVYKGLTRDLSNELPWELLHAFYLVLFADNVKNAKESRRCGRYVIQRRNSKCKQIEGDKHLEILCWSQGMVFGNVQYGRGM